MSRRCFIVLVLACIYLCLPVTSVEQNECCENEVLVECPASSPADCCPLSEADNKKSPQPDPCPPPKCKCQLNFRRAKNGTCIPTPECPPFDCVGPNEHYDPCPSFCPSDACGPRLITGICPFIIFILECNPKCTCDEGYGRLNGICVPFEQCPNICPENEEYHPCLQRVRRPQKCNENSPIPNTYINNKECEKGCICKKNYYRNQKGKCVTRNQCDVPMCPNPNEEYKVSSVPNCPILDHCFSILADIDCPGPEAPGCSCKDGYLRLDETSPCMPICDCPEMEGGSECQSIK